MTKINDAQENEALKIGEFDVIKPRLGQDLEFKIENGTEAGVKSFVIDKSTGDVNFHQKIKIQNKEFLEEFKNFQTSTSSELKALRAEIAALKSTIQSQKEKIDETKVYADSVSEDVNKVSGDLSEVENFKDGQIKNIAKAILGIQEVQYRHCFTPGTPKIYPQGWDVIQLELDKYATHANTKN